MMIGSRFSPTGSLFACMCLGLAVLLSGCQEGVLVPDGLILRPFNPSPQYQNWWTELEEATDHERPIEDVEFLEVMGPLDEHGNFPCLQEANTIEEHGPEETCAGQVLDYQQILIPSPHLDNQPLITHEMCHALLRQGHAQSLFQQCDQRFVYEHE